MKRKTYKNDEEFLQSLNAAQRMFFLSREKDHGDRLQEALRELSRGISVISAMGGECNHVVLNSGS